MEKKHIKIIILGFSVICLVYAFIIQDYQTIFIGFKNICTSTAGLITDYYVVGGIGATLVNCGLTTISCFFIYQLSKAEFNGMTLAAFFTIAGFSFFGKNMLNIWPIILGAYLYSKAFKVKFATIINIALFATSLSPFVSEAYFFIGSNYYTVNILFAIIIGIFIGFITPPIATFTPKCHQGYILYNCGFATGFVGMLLTSIMNFFNHHIPSKSIYSEEYHYQSLIFICIIIFFFLILYLIYDPKGYQKFPQIIKERPRYGYDSIIKLGTSPTLFNIITIISFYTILLIILGIPLSGPVIGGLLTIIGFAACGKTIYNTIFVAIGIISFTVLGNVGLSNISVSTAILLGTCLAPITSQFGPLFGIIAGIMHVCLVMNVAILHSGLNLYNSGFAAGLVCIFLIPIAEAFVERFPNCFLWPKKEGIKPS